MTRLLYKTKGDSEPGRKPKVYFSCLPEDFEMTFDAVCEDLFKTQDCIVFYKEDMADELPKETREIDLGRMNLFVFPVTFGMLRDEKSPVNDDLALADRERKPVLPIMFERNVGEIILEFYGRKFGERQYLTKFSNDLTEIGYADKLRKYLESTLIGDEMAQRIRKAFDAYVFLSYRKKDRIYANELMRLIHKDPTCRDIAVWFDEFLTPGESFNDSIEKALRDSRMVMLLVTPSLLENDAQGNKNYVQQVEYPNARQSGKPILPAEKVYTDRNALAADYEKLPRIIDANDEELFHEEFLKALNDVAKREESEEPMHNYLIGLAYLDGIDVEVNVEYGVRLVTKAAEDELPEAMKKLYLMYGNGNHVQLDYKKANVWAEKIHHYYLSRKGEEDPETLSWLYNLAHTYEWLADFTTAAKLYEKCYKTRLEVLGEENQDTLLAQSSLAFSLVRNGNYDEAAALEEKCYQIKCRVLGEEHPDTLNSLDGLAIISVSLGDYAKAVTLQEKSYEAIRRVLGMEHPDTLRGLCNLAVAYGYLGDYQKEYELASQCYETSCRVLGREHPDTLTALCIFANACRNFDDLEKVLELDQQCYEASCRVLGEDHPDTVAALNNLALDYHYLCDYEKELECFQKCHDIGRQLLGEDHPDTILFLGNLAVAYGDLGDQQKAFEINKKCYEARCRSLGEEHPLTLWSLNGLGYSYGELGDKEKAFECFEKCYDARRRLLGEEHPETIKTLANLAIAYRELGDHVKALRLGEQCYEAGCRVLGEQDRNTLGFLGSLACYRFLNGERDKATELFSKLHETLTDFADGDWQEELGHFAEMIEKMDTPEDACDLEMEGAELIRRIVG